MYPAILFLMVMDSTSVNSATILLLCWKSSVNLSLYLFTRSIATRFMYVGLIFPMYFSPSIPWEWRWAILILWGNPGSDREIMGRIGFPGLIIQVYISFKIMIIRAGGGGLVVGLVKGIVEGLVEGVGERFKKIFLMKSKY